MVIAPRLGRASRADRAAGRDRLVDGVVGADQAHRRQPYPACDPSRHRADAAGGNGVDRTRPARISPRLASRVRHGCCAFAAAALVLLFTQIMFGAFTAGLDAGYAFSSWPLMGERDLPRRHADDRADVAQRDRQSDRRPVHPPLARLRRGGGRSSALGWRRDRGRTRRESARIAIALVAGQILLGIATLLSGVEIVVAVAHQANAALAADRGDQRGACRRTPDDLTQDSWTVFQIPVGKPAETLTFRARVPALATPTLPSPRGGIRHFSYVRSQAP